MREITHGDIWAADYIDKFSSSELIVLANASSFFELPTLSNLAVSKIATLFNKYQDDIPKLRELFGIEEDMTEEEVNKFLEEENKKYSPYELMIRENLEVWYPYSEEHNKEDEKS